MSSISQLTLSLKSVKDKLNDLLIKEILENFLYSLSTAGINKYVIRRSRSKLE